MKKQFQDSKAKQQVQPIQSSLVDPAVNAIIVQLKRELEDTKKKKEELQSELNSWKFNAERFFLNLRF